MQNLKEFPTVHVHVQIIGNCMSILNTECQNVDLNATFKMTVHIKYTLLTVALTQCPLQGHYVHCHMFENFSSADPEPDTFIWCTIPVNSLRRKARHSYVHSELQINQYVR